MTLEALFEMALTLTGGSTDLGERQAYIRGMCHAFRAADLEAVKVAVGKHLQEKSFRPTIADINRHLDVEDRSDDWQRQAEVYERAREETRQLLIASEQHTKDRRSNAAKMTRLKLALADKMDPHAQQTANWIYTGETEGDVYVPPPSGIGGWTAEEIELFRQNGWNGFIKVDQEGKRTWHPLSEARIAREGAQSAVGKR